MTEKKIGVFGGGSWATAIVKLLLNNDLKKNQLNWYMRNQKSVDYINQHHHNPHYLSSVELNLREKPVYLSDDINQIVERSDILIFVIPAAFLMPALSKLKVSLKNKCIISAIKGIIPDGNLIITEFFNKKYRIPLSSIGVLSGPCHAEEVALERLSYLTIACKKTRQAEEVAGLFDCRYIKTRISSDIHGIEYAAVLKNIYALAAGICHGLGYGDNFQAVLISNAMRELRRFVRKVYPVKRKPKTKSHIFLRRIVKSVQPVHRVFNSSVYFGDLLVTAYSQFSRNRTFGTMIGKGYSVKAAQMEMNMIAEGYYAVRSIHEINKKHLVSIPICDSVYNILYENKNPAKEIEKLTESLR